MLTYNEIKYKLKNFWNTEQFYDIAYNLLKNKKIVEPSTTIQKHSIKKIGYLPGYEFPISNTELPFIVKVRVVPQEYLFLGNVALFQSIGNKYYYNSDRSCYFFNPR